MRITDERMIEALITTENITKCAEMLGCNRKSIYDRLRKGNYLGSFFILFQQIYFIFSKIEFEEMNIL